MPHANPAGTAPMTVGISTTMIQSGKSGVAQYVFALVRSLFEVGATHRFHLFVLEDDLPLFKFATERAGITVVPERYRNPVRNILWHQTRLPDLARELRLDVLHVPSYRRLLWPKPCPLVATIHDLAPFRVSGKYDPARMFYGKVIVKRLARRQDRIIAVSSNTARDIETFFGIPHSRQHVVLNGIDHDRFKPADRGEARAEARQRWQLERPYLLYVSRLEHPAKNHVRLIQAYERFRQTTRLDWELVLAGGDWHGAEVIRAAAQASMFSANIRLPGFVHDEHLPLLYRAAEMFVYPSLFEGFGFPPVEAMACGCPVVSSNRGSLEEVIGDAATPVDPEDVGNIAEALKRVATDEQHRAELIAAGFANARRFDWKENARAVLEIYRAAASAT
jgi:glycosyltransferase involved in cell wall biosynthesis